MSRSRRFAGRQTASAPLEFLLDRGLGKNVATELSRLGWIVHRITDIYPDDARKVDDEDWIRYGVERGWVPLCKDGRIKGRDDERSPLVVHRAALFYLDNQQLSISEMVHRFHTHRGKIERRARRGGPACYAVTADDVRKTWP